MPLCLGYRAMKAVLAWLGTGPHLLCDCDKEHLVHKVDALGDGHAEACAWSTRASMQHEFFCVANNLFARQGCMSACAPLRLQICAHVRMDARRCVCRDAGMPAAHQLQCRKQYSLVAMGTGACLTFWPHDGPRAPCLLQDQVQGHKQPGNHPETWWHASLPWSVAHLLAT